MNQLRAGHIAPQTALKPTEGKADGASKMNRPEFRFHKTVIESWLIKSHMLDADTSAVKP